MTNAIAKKQNGATRTPDLATVVDNLFQNSFRRFFDDNFWDSENQPATGTVPVNIRETDHAYELDLIAPGCHKEDFKINVQDNVLTISMDQKEEKNQEDERTGWVRNEYVQRGFSRSFTLNDTVDLDKINATYTDGILRLSLGKNEKARKLTRNITVN